MAQVVVVEGPDRGRVIALEGASITVGRDASCGIVLADTAVSRRHCEIRHDGDAWILVDLGSSNRTYLNNDPVAAVPLDDGDLVGVGDSELRFELAGDEIRQEDLNTTILREYRMAGAAPQDVDAGARAMLKLSILADLARRVEGEETSDGLLRSTVRELVPALGAQWGVALIHGVRGWSLAARAGVRVKSAFSRTLLERLRESGERVLCADVAGDAAFSASESIQVSRTQSVIAAPLETRGQLLGALYFARREGRFAQDDLFLASGACNQIAVLLAALLRQEALQNDQRTLLAQIREQHRIVGPSAAMTRVLEFIARAAPSDATVLVRGETGTGKELVASAIHYASARAGKPFVQINCAAIPEQLLESELFGHEKGAFTGATARKPGKFEAADGGTVLLDEVGELSPACQAKVLRLIEERRFERVGGTESLHADVRILAATNRDLRRAIEAGRFREDLYWRLDVLHVELPPLRERPEDITPLAAHFLARLAGARGEAMSLSPAAREALMAYSWPGNVRQLRNVLENAVIMAAGDGVDAHDLRLIELGGAGARAAAGGKWEPLPLAEVEKEHILRVLQWSGGNKKQAAEALGIERCTLYARLRAYGRHGKRKTAKR